MNNLSLDRERELRYIVSWFNEWSELQREDFVPVMVDYLAQETADPVYMNGVVHSVAHAEITDKPMSLFQCRIKLFREWAPKWPLEFKHKLKEKIMEIDTKVGEKIINETKGQSHTNGHDNGNENGSALAADEVNAVPAASDRVLTAAAATEEVLLVDEVADADNSQLALPNNEMSVDNDADADANRATETVAVTVVAPPAVVVNAVLVEPAEQVDEIHTQQIIHAAAIASNAEVPLVT